MWLTSEPPFVPLCIPLLHDFGTWVGESWALGTLGNVVTEREGERETEREGEREKGKEKERQGICPGRFNQVNELDLSRFRIFLTSVLRYPALPYSHQPAWLSRRPVLLPTTRGLYRGGATL